MLWCVRHNKKRRKTNSAREVDALLPIVSSCQSSILTISICSNESVHKKASASSDSESLIVEENHATGSFLKSFNTIPSSGDSRAPVSSNSLSGGRNVSHRNTNKSASPHASMNSSSRRSVAPDASRDGKKKNSSAAQDNNGHVRKEQSSQGAQGASAPMASGDGGVQSCVNQPAHIFVAGEKLSVHELLGRGGFGEVYKVKRTNLPASAINTKSNYPPLALKCVKARNPKEFESVQREVKMMEKLSGNPRIIQIHSSQEMWNTGSILIVMELATCDFKQRVKARRDKGNPLNLAEICRYWVRNSNCKNAACVYSGACCINVVMI